MNKKTIIWIGAIIGGLIVLVIVGSKIKSLIEAWKEVRDFKSEQTVLEAQGVKLTYPKSWYEQKARELYTAMNSTWYDPTSYGTDEDRIATIFGQLENDLDFIELYTAYGIKDGYDLREWIDGDLSQDWKDKINGQLSNNGLSKRI